MEVRVKQESQDEALVPLCAGNSKGLEMESSASGSCSPSGSAPSNGVDGGNNLPGPMQKVPSLSDLSDAESSLGKSTTRWLFKRDIFKNKFD